MGEPERREIPQTELPLIDSTLPQARSVGEESDGETLEWVCHPVRRRPLVSVAVTVFVLSCCFVTYVSTDSTWFAGLALAVLIGSLAKFYFPTRYRLTPRGVTVKTTTQTLTKEWSIYRSYYPDRNGVLLSPFVEPSRLENFRGLYLIFNNNAEQVKAYVRRYVRMDDVSSGTGDTP